MSPNFQYEPRLYKWRDVKPMGAFRDRAKATTNYNTELSQKNSIQCAIL